MTDKTFAEQVAEVVDKLEQKGDVWELPAELLETVPESVAYAAKQEKRIRDNSAAFHKERRRVKELETTNAALTEHAIANSTLHITKEQRDELDELKLTDPEAWRTKLTSYETEAKAILRDKFKEISSESSKLSELDERKLQTAAFKEATGIELTDDIVENQLPASYTKQLEKGEITYAQFLLKAQSFLQKEKVVKDEGKEVKNQPDLGELPGGGEPTAQAQDKDFVKQYTKNTIF